MSLERTLIILKPDAVQRGLCGEILTSIREKGTSDRRLQADEDPHAARRDTLRAAQGQAVLRRVW